MRELVCDMVDTMYAAPGIGLAANQVGVARRVCVVDLTAGEQPDALKVFINPGSSPKRATSWVTRAASPFRTSPSRSGVRSR